MQFGDRRQVNYLLLAAIYAYVLENPGCRQAQVAGDLGINRGALYNKMTTLQNRGFLLAEDDNGRLYPFRVCGA